MECFVERYEGWEIFSSYLYRGCIQGWPWKDKVKRDRCPTKQKLGNVPLLVHF